MKKYFIVLLAVSFLVGMTVDAYEVPELEDATIHATKIVCPTEDLLPNWGDGSPEFNLTANTAQRFINANPSCHIEPWTFEWAPKDTANPGDNIAVAGGAWTPFVGSSVEVPPADRIWLREQVNNQYIPFSGDLSADGGWQDVSAEMYCNNDSLNYDNYDWIDNVEAGEDYYCVAFNVLKETPLECNPQVNLIANGDFETPVVSTPEMWNTFASGFAGLEWLVDWLSPVGAPSVANLELHRGVNGWLPPVNGGSQYAELDTDYGAPPSNPGGSASVSIAQDIQTIPGKNYKLAFDFSPRPGTASVENAMEALFGGVIVITVPPTAGVSNTLWTPYDFTFMATSTNTRITFRDAGTPSNSFGPFLDNVSLTCVEREECEPASGSVVSDGNTEVTFVDVNGTTSGTDFPAIPVTVVSEIQTLAPDVWVADVGDPNAKWIWSEDPYDANYDVNKWVTFTRQFIIDGTGTQKTGTLKIASDNSYEVWVNGNPVGSDPNENNHSVADTWDVSNFLQNGSNTLEIRVKNWALPGQPKENNPGGLLFNLSWANACNGDGPDDPGTSKVFFKKYIVGNGPAAYEGDNSPTFELNIIGAGNGNLILDDGSNYAAESVPVTNGNNNVTVYESTTFNNPESKVIPYGEICSAGKFRFAGYGVGGSFTDAAAAATTTTDLVLNSIDSDKYVVVWNELCPDVSTVKMCKTDDATSSNPLSGWTMMLLQDLVEGDISVNPASLTGVNTSASLTAGQPYVAIADGTWNNQNGANPVDAEYSTTDTWLTQMDGYTGYGLGILELEINQTDGSWGPFNSLHTYAQEFTPSLTGPANFRIFDGDTSTHAQNESWYGDNSGSLLVDVYKGYAGVTAMNETQSEACVTFNNVPYGDYKIGEVDKEGWSIVTPLDPDSSVTIDSPSETFTIKNALDGGGEPIVCGEGQHSGEVGCVPNPQCSDGEDNDSDGLIDYPADTGCASSGDDNESNQIQQLSLTSPEPSGGSLGGGHRRFVLGGLGEVLGASTDGGLMCEEYLKSYIRLGANNDPEDVKRLQTFLNQFFEVDNPVTGFYGPITYGMVKKFQTHQNDAVLIPWSISGFPTDGPTGYVYKTTRRWINILKCPEMLASLPIPYPLVPSSGNN